VLGLFVAIYIEARVGQDPIGGISNHPFDELRESVANHSEALLRERQIQRNMGRLHPVTATPLKRLKQLNLLARV
jgi:hypothetical protein